METKTTTFNPELDVKLSDGKTVTVHHLKWKAALKFFGMLREKISGFVNDKGELAATPAGVMDALQKFPELAEWLVLQSTRRDEKFLEELDLTDMSKLVFKSLELNLGTIASEIKNFRGRLAALAAGPEQTIKSNPTSPASAS